MQDQGLRVQPWSGRPTWEELSCDDAVALERNGRAVTGKKEKAQSSVSCSSLVRHCACPCVHCVFTIVREAGVHCVGRGRSF